MTVPSAILDCRLKGVRALGSWIDEVEFAPGEQLVWKRLANRQQGAYRAVGGRLFLTDRRLIFMPHKVDRATGGNSWSQDLANITRAAIEPRHYGVPLVTRDVGLRRRLRVEQHDGTVDVFVVNRVEDVVGSINEALAT